MGGDSVSIQASSIDDDDLSTVKPEFSQCLCGIPTSRPDDLSRETAKLSEFVFRESDARIFRDYDNTLGTEANELSSVYAQVIKNYDDLKFRAINMEAAKSKVLSYKPGSWVESVGGMSKSDYNVPKTTTLLLIGPKGSGKSSLVNRISRVFEDDKFAPERAQVTFNSSVHGGTRFLHEYMIPRNSTSFCLYDTCGFSNDSFANLKMIWKWMTKGVCHGELVESVMDSSSLHAEVENKTYKDDLLTYKRRRVDFVILVVNGLSVLRCMESSGADTLYMHTVTEVFNSPCLSFKDHKPSIAITHGDLLSVSERARVRVYLGDHLGVHPSKQTFDIPDDSEPTTELTIVDLVRYALEHADRNLPFKSRPIVSKGEDILQFGWLLLLLALGIAAIILHLHGSHFPKLHPEKVHVRTPNVTESGQQDVCERDVEVKKVAEIDPGIGFKQPIDERKKDVARSKCKCKTKKKQKKVYAESSGGKKQKTKKVRGLGMEIVWKKIRHLWYV